MAATKILDAYALIAFFENEPGADYVRGLLLEAESGITQLLMSVVNLGEIWYSVAREISTEEADAIVREIFNMSIEVVDADWEVTHQAAIFKKIGGLSYSDCFAAALGKLRDAEVITGDPEFQKLKEEVSITWQSN